MKLSPDKKLDVSEILKGLENYRPGRRVGPGVKRLKTTRLARLFIKTLLNA